MALAIARPLLAAAAGAAFAAVGAPAVAGDERPLALAPDFAATPFAARRPLSFALSDRLELAISTGKLKSLGQLQSRQVDRPGGGSPPPRAARVGILLRW